MILFILIGVIILCLLLEGFFSGSEIALISANKANLQQIAKHSQGAKLALALLRQPEKLLTTTLVGTNTMVIASSFAANELFARIWGSEYAAYSALIMIPAILIVGEITPKALFRLNADKISFRIAYPLKIAMMIFYPAVYPIVRLIRFFRVIRLTEGKKITPYVTKKELKLILKSEQSYGKSAHTKAQLIYRLLDFANIRVSSIMSPLFKEMSLNFNASIKEAAYLMHRAGLRRMAVYRKRNDNIVGFIYAEDLLGMPSKDGKVKSFIRKPLFVPELMRLSQLLHLFKEKERDIAVVVDEYGSTIGLVSLRELLREILAEPLVSRIKPRLKKLIPLGNNIFLADGELKLNRLAEALDIDLEGFKEETLGGLLLRLAQKIPQAGEEFIAAPLKIKVLSATANRVDKLRLEVPGKGK